jgi:hypothetical protein
VLSHVTEHYRHTYVHCLFVHLTAPGQLSATTNQATSCTWCDTLQNQEPLKMTTTHIFESSGRINPATLTPLPAGFEVLAPVSLHGLRCRERPGCWLFLVPLSPEVEITEGMTSEVLNNTSLFI